MRSLPRRARRPRRPGPSRVARAAAATAAAALLLPVALDARASGAGPAGPSDPAYQVRDLQNIAAAYGRVTSGQLGNPAYLPALTAEIGRRAVAQMLAQAANPLRLAITPGQLVPGWNVGNPLRAGWVGTRGRAEEVAFTNRYGALLHGTVWAPAADARDPYTGERLRGPYPGVVITEGSVGGSEGMYEWLAQDLAERGYVVLTYDVQGQGRSETLPHTSGQATPFCDVFAAPVADETTGCPGVPFQQLSNFTVGTRDALDFFVSTPSAPAKVAPGGEGATTPYNPFWRLFDRSPDPRPATPGRTTRIAIIGHSLGAQAVSLVQGRDERVAAVVALDKLRGDGGVRPSVPALAVQSEYGFTVQPWWLGGGGITPAPSPSGPDPMRERRTGFEAWRKAGLDTMLVVPRASTHLEYTDIPLVLPASRYGQDLTSVYVQAWLDRYLKHADDLPVLLGGRFRYLEPQGGGVWAPVTLRRDDLLSFYYCSAYDVAGRRDLDIAGVGC
ncbi:hypothetical protein GCM10022215_36590 [Nocardioides fonticola]|uniref:Alpha/beta hydrolase n=1 Tax=Nocardioides fonticola TaxID=450363 RepID=A0ABP7XVJ7_9ACTN